MSTTMAEWKFRRRQGACTACERGFEEGERHPSLLCIEGEELSRLDLCAACWRARRAGAAAAGGAEEAGLELLFYWFSRHRASRRRTLDLDLASLERLFLELEGRKERALREVRYLLCLLLMRKKRLKLLRVRRGRAGEALIVRRPRRKEELAVHVFDFDAERLDELRSKLQEILEGAGSESGEGAEGENGEPGGASGDEPSGPEIDAPDGLDELAGREAGADPDRAAAAPARSARRPRSPL